jgi:hypothetical protein
MKAIGYTTAVLVAAIAIAAAGCASTASHAQPIPPAPRATPTTYTNPATPAAATPNPDGTYSGSCDYTLSDNFTDMSAAGTLIGEIDVMNTGNVGTVTSVRITWPQEGFEPVTAHRTVHVPSGRSKTVRFHVTASQNMIAELQSWQESHNYRKGCTFHAAITGTYGTPH